MAKCRHISSTDGFAFIFAKNHPQNPQNRAKKHSRGATPPPGNIFIKEKKRKLYDRQNRHNMAIIKRRVKEFSITQTPALWHLRVKMQGLFVSFFRDFLPAGSGE
jgi:hypothetical protein